MRRKILPLLIIGLTISGAIIGGYFWYWQGTPRHALYQMVRAIQNRDIQKFFNYIDLQAIFNNLIQDASQDLSYPGTNEPGGESPEDEWTRWSRRIGKKFARFLLPKLFSTFETQIKAQIEKYLRNLNTRKTLGLTAIVAQARIQQQGQQAQITLLDPQTNKPLRFRMQRDPETGNWRIVEVNYLDLKEFIKKEVFE